MSFARIYLEYIFFNPQALHYKPLKEIQCYKYWVAFEDKSYKIQYNLTMLVILLLNS